MMISRSAFSDVILRCRRSFSVVRGPSFRVAARGLQPQVAAICSTLVSQLTVNLI
jgi:hypothetical protein